MSIYKNTPKKYFDSTVSIDPSSFLAPLEQRLKPGDHILDVGCGSGRGKGADPHGASLVFRDGDVEVN